MRISGPFSSLLIFFWQSRTAARKELLDQATSPDECEKLYDESLWCLYALQDDLLQTGNPFMDEDRETIATCLYLSNAELYTINAPFIQGSNAPSSDLSDVAPAWP